MVFVGKITGIFFHLWFIICFKFKSLLHFYNLLKTTLVFVWFLCYQFFVDKQIDVCWLIDWLIDLLCLMPLSAIFQLYHGDQFYWWKKPEYLERTTDHGQATGKLYHLKLLVKCFFVIYKAGHEPTPYWW